MDVVLLVLFGVVIGGVRSAPKPVVAPPELTLQLPSGQGLAPVTYVTRHHVQDEIGQVNYGFSHPGQAKNEHRDAAGNVAGEYTYLDEDNKVIVVKYTAGEGGFQVTSNNLPVAVKDTPEVVAAKLQFVEQYNKAALAAAVAAEKGDGLSIPLKTGNNENINVGLPIKDISSPIKDTPEVVAAKLQFVEAYNEAAIAAANAPDDQELSSSGATVVNPNPVRDTDEVIAAKMQFVEAYNAAALAAAKAAKNSETHDASEVSVVYAIPAVQDTPEVIQAKLQFVKLYNEAALAAARAPDEIHDRPISNDVSDDDTEFDKNQEPEPVTDLGILSDQEVQTTLSPRDVLSDQEVQTTLSPRDEDSNAEPITVFPLFNQENKVEIIPNLSPEDENIDSEPTTIFPFVNYEDNRVGKTYNLVPRKINNAPQDRYNTNVPQAHSYGVFPPKVTQQVDTPVLKSTDIQPEVVRLNTQQQLDTQEQTEVVPVDYVHIYHAQDELGQVNYGFTIPGQTKNEIRDASGNVAGAYAYIDDDNKEVRVEYTAGEEGFQVRANNLPIAVGDTPEVLAAKLQFVEAYNAAALAAAAAPDDEESSFDEVASPYTIPNPVQDTPEVLAAKLSFVEAYNKAALAAANAPDDVAITDSASSGSPILIQDTPDVTSAKLQFVETYNAAALTAANAGNHIAILSHGYHAVADTPEVIAAKIKFVEAYNKAALAAAIAPDDPVEYQEFKFEDMAVPTQVFPQVQTIENSDSRIQTVLSESPEVNENLFEIHVPAVVLQIPSEVETYSLVPSIVSALEESSAALRPVLSLQPPVIDTPIQDSSVPVTYVSRHHAQNELGEVNYGFSQPDQAKNEVRDSDGNVAGIYTYINLDDKVIRVEYTAGEEGFQVKSNNLPIAPNDTPEVLAAKLQFVKEYNKAALAAAAAPDDEIIESDSSSVMDISVPSPIPDTPEVIAAKLAFVKAYNEAALAAANAPDDPDVQLKSAVNTPTVELVAPTLFTLNSVQDTSEVITAKLQFVESYNDAAIAAAEANDLETQNSLHLYTPVQDTPEVMAAKLQFVEQYNAAALASALAPDDEIDQTITNPEEIIDDTSPDSILAVDSLQSLDENVNRAKPQTAHGTLSFVQQGVPNYFNTHGFLSRYASFTPRVDGTIPAHYAYSIPYGIYGLPTRVLSHGISKAQNIPVTLIQNTDNLRPSLYAPAYAYLG